MDTSFWPGLAYKVDRSFVWEQRLTLNNLSLGVYTFKFSALDNEGFKSHDDVIITVTDKNLAPIANSVKIKRLN